MFDRFVKIPGGSGLYRDTLYHNLYMLCDIFEIYVLMTAKGTWYDLEINVSILDHHRFNLS